MGRRARLYADHRLRPPRLAEELAVLDDISREEFAMFDVPMKERAKRVTEVVTTLKSAFTGEQFSYRGRTVRVTPAPYRPGDPAVLLGGSSEPAARRAARIADGFVIGVGTVGEDAVLEVADEGPGLSPAQTAHIFERGEFAVGGVPVNGASGPGSWGERSLGRDRDRCRQDAVLPPGQAQDGGEQDEGGRSRNDQRVRVSACRETRTRRRAAERAPARSASTPRHAPVPMRETRPRGERGRGSEGRRCRGLGPYATRYPSPRLPNGRPVAIRFLPPTSITVRVLR
ncbi:LLM class flavin-dependent oxidoreductase [Streptomyces sp. NPDC051642]|uniref:LLM class flavin-dependent oxidoreductase n=1 Tax=Streptomyces sp. NPDC051642 TaxID=3154646 RepID=UPI00341BAD35